MTDNQTAVPDGPPTQQLELELPQIDLNLQGSGLTIHANENGDKLLVIGPVMLRVGIPLSSDGARELARQLTGGIEIASVIPAR